MRYDTYKQYAIVQGNTAHDLTEQLNAKLYELRNKNPVVTFEGLIARIEYDEDEQKAETLAEEFELKGVKLTCYQCPMFEPLLNKDGTENRSAKRGGCIFRPHGMTHRDVPACSKLFEMLNDGRIFLCLND